MPAKKIISQAAHVYTLYEQDDIYCLVVICGTVAIFEVTVELTEQQVTEFHYSGDVYLQNLSKKIRETPHKYI